MTKSTIINLPGWAEDQFSRLCATAGVVRNKATHDASGWDYIIQFPNKVDDATPQDLVPGEISARVQVKSKGKGRATTTVKLSNALRFAKEDAPCFIALFLATKGSEPVRIYCKHIWKDDIELALRRAREVSRDGRVDLNNIRLTCNFSATDEHTDDLIEWMKSTIESVGHDYTRDKKSIHDNAGFENGRVSGTFTFRTEDLPALVDHQIGLIPTAPIENIVLAERRFDINGPVLFDGKPTFISIKPGPRPCRVRIYSHGGTDIWIDGEVYVPAIPNLPEELRKLRIKADFIEIVGTPNAFESFTFNMESTEQRTLPQWRAYTDVMQLLVNGNALLDVRVDDKLLYHGALNADVGLNTHQLLQFSTAIACFETATHGRLPVDFTFSSQQFAAYGPSIINFISLISAVGIKLNATVEPFMPFNSEFTASAIYMYDWLEIGEWIILSVVRRAVADYVFTGDTLSFNCVKPHVIESIVRRGKATEYKQEIVEAYRRATQMDPHGSDLQIADGHFTSLLGMASSLGDR